MAFVVANVAMDNRKSTVLLRHKVKFTIIRLIQAVINQDVHQWCEILLYTEGNGCYGLLHRRIITLSSFNTFIGGQLFHQKYNLGCTFLYLGWHSWEFTYERIFKSASTASIYINNDKLWI